MKQKIYETRQRAEKILSEAVAAWSQSNQSEHLENIGDDPTFSLFMMALAYEVNDMDFEIERIKNEILEEFTNLLVPYEQINAIPASALVELKLDQRVPEMVLDQHTTFTVNSSQFLFMPLLRTRLFNVQLNAVTRIDNRRWKVGLEFKEPVKSLAGMTFMISKNNFQDLKVFFNGRPLPLIKPWDYSDLPFNDNFAIDNLIYAQSQVYQSNSTWFDLFATHNMNMFCVDSYKEGAYKGDPSNKIELTFEFIGGDEEFYLDKSHLFFNTAVILNVVKDSFTLSPSTPLVQIATDSNAQKLQFLNLVAPSDLQVLNEENISVRKVMANRFNADHLIRLTRCLINKYRTDYYAFQRFKEFADGSFLDNFYLFAKKLEDGILDRTNVVKSGIYVSFKNKKLAELQGLSLQLDYLMTNGSAVNKELNDKSNFRLYTPGNIESVVLLSTPTLGYDEPTDKTSANAVSRYYMITGDRIVTPVDIKMLCYKELLLRYDIPYEMITNIRVRQHRLASRYRGGMEILVYIFLKKTSYLKETFAHDIPRIEILLQKMIEVRSTNVYPVRVSITLE